MKKITETRGWAITILLYRHPYKIQQFYNINHDIHSYFMYAFNLPIMKIGVELTHQNMTQQTKDNLRKSSQQG